MLLINRGCGQSVVVMSGEVVVCAVLVYCVRQCGSCCGARITKGRMLTFQMRTKLGSGG